MWAINPSTCGVKTGHVDVRCQNTECPVRNVRNQFSKHDCQRIWLFTCRAACAPQTQMLKSGSTTFGDQVWQHSRLHHIALGSISEKIGFPNRHPFNKLPPEWVICFI